MSTGPATAGAPPRWRDGLAPALAGWAVSRVLLAGAYALARSLVERWPSPQAVDPTEHGLVIWDGMFYRMLAEDWYTAARPDAARFFPLYPALGRVLSPLTGGDHALALLVVSNVVAIGAALLVWRLVVEVVGDRGAANRAAWLVGVFPSAFVLALPYTEALAVALVAGTLLALHRRWFVVGGSLAFAAALLRPVGVLLLVPIVVELWRCRPRPPVPNALVAVAGPLLGLGTAMVWIERATGDLLRPVTEQRVLRGGFQDPVTRMLEPIGELVRGNAGDVENLLWMWLLVGLLLLGIRQRQPLSWIAFSAVSLVVTYSAQVVDSVGRYGLAVVPLVVALATGAGSRRSVVAVALLSGGGFVALATLAWMGQVVP